MGWKSRKNPTDPGAKMPPGHPFFDLIEEAYRAFDGYKPSDVDVCTICCLPKAIEADFFRPNIKDLPLHYLREWFGAACATEGVRKDIWSYLLPRTIEVLAMGEEPKNVGIEVSLSRFDTGNPSHWSDKQWSVLDRFQRQFLQSSSPSTGAWRYHTLDDIICMFTLGGWQLDDLLSQVMSMADEQLVERLYQIGAAPLATTERSTLQNSGRSQTKRGCGNSTHPNSCAKDWKRLHCQTALTPRSLLRLQRS